MNAQSLLIDYSSYHPRSIHRRSASERALRLPPLDPARLSPIHPGSDLNLTRRSSSPTKRLRLGQWQEVGRQVSQRKLAANDDDDRTSCGESVEFQLRSAGKRASTRSSSRSLESVNERVEMKREGEIAMMDMSGWSAATSESSRRQSPRLQAHQRKGIRRSTLILDKSMQKPPSPKPAAQSRRRSPLDAAEEVAHLEDLCRLLSSGSLTKKPTPKASETESSKESTPKRNNPQRKHVRRTISQPDDASESRIREMTVAVPNRHRRTRSFLIRSRPRLDAQL